MASLPISPHFLANHDRTNTDLAIECDVDNSTIVRWRKITGLSSPRRTEDWTPAMDAVFFEAIADGSTIENAGALVGMSKGSAHGRFGRIRMAYGWQGL